MTKRKIFCTVLAVALPLTLAVCGTAAVAPRVLPTATATFTPGTFTVSYGVAGTPAWRQGPLVLDVTFAEDQITGIDVISHGETTHSTGWFFRAFPAVPDQILARQSTRDIDAFTGATVTRNAFINAVNDAIAQAGASPEALVPQISAAPLPGDRFIPGFHVITVPAGTMDIYGAPLTAATPADRVMLYNPEVDMTLRVSVGRNEFHLHGGGAAGLAQGSGGHGEGVHANQISDDTWGGRWFSQVAHHQVNDYQATRNIDIYAGATRTAAAIVWGVEQALVAAGGNPAALAPRQVPPMQMQRNPAAPNAPFFVPGHYTVTVPYAHMSMVLDINGPITLTVTVDRGAIRRIVVDSHNEPEEQWALVWPSLRDSIYRTQNLDEVVPIAGAEALSGAIIVAVRMALAMADPGDR